TRCVSLGGHHPSLPYFPTRRSSDLGPPGFVKSTLPAENSGKIPASRQAITTSRYHSSRPGPPPQELLTTSGALSTRSLPSASIEAMIHSATYRSSASVPPAYVNALTAIHSAPGATPT